SRSVVIPPRRTAVHSRPPSAGYLFHALADIFTRIVDQLIGAVLLCNRQLLRSSGAGNDFRSHSLADLNCGKADSTGRAKDQQPLARLEMGTPLERAVRCAV